MNGLERQDNIFAGNAGLLQIPSDASRSSVELNPNLIVDQIHM